MSTKLPPATISNRYDCICRLIHCIQLLGIDAHIRQLLPKSEQTQPLGISIVRVDGFRGLKNRNGRSKAACNQAAICGYILNRERGATHKEGRPVDSHTLAEQAALLPTEQQYLPLRKVVAVGVGNALEFYDFLTFSFFAIQIGHCFFPQSQTSHGLLYSLATFGVGFLMRPLGGVLIGMYGDRVGRKPAMVLSFALMGASILGLALTPSYAQIGIAAPILLVIFRIVQGFALGGEVGPSTAFLVEAAPPNRRGFYVSLQYMTQDLAVLGAGVAGFLLTTCLTPAALDAWGWRIAFLIGTAVVPIGLHLRRNLPETLHDADRRVTRAEQRRVPVRLIVLALMLIAAVTIYIYGLDYITTYAQDSLHMTPALAFGATMVIGICAVAADPLSGLLSDRIGRRPVMLGAVVILMLLLVPAYMAMTELRSVLVVYGASAILAVLQALLTAPALVTVTESLPKTVRSGALSMIYAVAASVFGGSTQFAIKGLIDLTGNALAPAWYMTGAVLIGGIAMTLMRETAPVKVGLAPGH
jgi:MHS family citrate/tricarballylate:H+ symporter-like MFS transporter